MFGMGNAGAAAAKEAVMLLRVMELATTATGVKAALEELLTIKAETDKAQAAADEMVRAVATRAKDLETRELAIASEAEASAAKVNQANSMAAEAAAKLDEANTQLAEAGTKFAEAEEALSAARAAEVNATTKEARSRERLANAEAAAAQALAQAEEAAQRYTVLETQCLELEARLAAAKEAAAKLLGG